jgi:hypothetical protein
MVLYATRPKTLSPADPCNKVTQLLFGGMGRPSENCVLSIKNKSHSITAEIEVPEKGAEGVIVAQGANIGGWSLYAKNGKLKYCYNLAGVNYYYVEATRALPAGEHQVRMEFAYAGGGLGKGGQVTLYVDGEKVGEGAIPMTQAIVFSADDGCDVGEDSGAPVSQDYGSRGNAFNGTVKGVQLAIGDAAESSDHLVSPEDAIRIAPWHGSRDCGGPSLSLPPLPLPPCHWFSLDKKHPRQPAFAERLAEDAEGEIRNEHQQHDEVAGECFLQPDASELAKRGGDRPMVEQADDGFLDDGQDYQQHEEGERPMQRRPDQRAGGVALADLHCAADQHEFGQQHGFDDGDAPGGEIDALCMQHGGLHHDHCADSDVEVDRKDRELLELVSGALGQRRFRVGLGCHDDLLSRRALSPAVGFTSRSGHRSTTRLGRSCHPNSRAVGL